MKRILLKLFTLQYALLVCTLLPDLALAGTCGGNKPRVHMSVTGDPNKVRLNWQYDGPDECRDVYNIRFGVIGGNQQQIEVGGAFCPTQGNNNKQCFHHLSIIPGKPYRFNVQACNKRAFQASDCSSWGEDLFLPSGRDSCKDGFVWREAFPGDHVCVSFDARETAKKQNQAAASHVSATDRRFGPDTCNPGFVWREASTNDHICVTPQERQTAKNQNAQAASLRAD